ncbi:MAG: phenylalanine--tRNA ligase subunit beta [Candidatus Micrarchaeota archaeon]|nr:phenylalanine--tRNA ligase subunit beta [Candidatus Micrarchaeota archaeon]
MAQVNFPFLDLYELYRIEESEAIELLTNLGFPAEKLPTGELTVEVTPNRPDCLCVEGLARVLKCYLEREPVHYRIGEARIETLVEPSVGEVRPAFGCAVVRNVKMTDSFLRSLMQVQEKLHETIGRKRRKVAIGIHDLDRVAPPFRYFACGKEDVRFVPLESRESMTPLEILRRHPKGMEYAHLVGEKCPMIEDSRRQVLSFPPIINGELTKLTERTTNLFIDCTGTSSEAVRQTVNILVAMLADRGGEIEEAKVNGKPYPLLHESRWPLPTKESERLLGIPLSDNKVGELLLKMGHRIEGNWVFVPGYRADIMNEVDLIEDVAIAYGFNRFEPILPEFNSLGASKPPSSCHEILVGLGFCEALTWTLSSKEAEEKAGIRHENCVEIENPLTSEFTMFRTSILPNLLSLLSESKNEKLPAKVYEIGPVYAPSKEERICIASMHPRACFSEIKGVVLALFEELDLPVELKEESSPSFIEGRCAGIYHEGRLLGRMGEISPQVLVNFNLEQPVCAAELRLP